jgi:hypothetical protein
MSANIAHVKTATQTSAPPTTNLASDIAAVEVGNYEGALKVLNHPKWAELETQFWNASHPLDVHARAAFGEYLQLVQTLWQRMGAGSIRPLSVYRSTLSSKLSIDVSLRVLAKIYAGCNLAYAATPAGFWRTVYSITGYVVSRCREGEETEYESLKNMCLQLWLMAWLNPLSLVAGRLPVAVRLVGLLSKTCSYSLAPPTHAGSGLAAADLMQDRAPMPFGRIAGDWNPQLPLYVNAQSAAYAIEELRKKQSDQPQGGDMYEALLGAGRLAGLTAPEVNDFVKRALREFGQSHQRAIPRIASQGSVQLVVGMIDVWTAILQNNSPQVKTKTAAQPMNSDVVNHSEGGFLLRVPITTPTLRAGSLLAMRGTDAEPWTLCAIRWLQDNTSEVLVGVEVLSNFAEAKLCVTADGQQQAPLISYEAEDQKLVFVTLGQGDFHAVSQVLIESDSWILSAVRELGEDWELRSVLDEFQS